MKFIDNYFKGVTLKEMKEMIIFAKEEIKEDEEFIKTCEKQILEVLNK